MSAGSEEGLSEKEEEATGVSVGAGGRDRLAALVSGLEPPTARCVDDLLLAWRDAQRETSRAYAHWHELARVDGHTVYLAALDREERAAGVYAEVRSALARPPNR